ncbi:MAG: monovalent cation/H(+) antiporter subunit G [Spirochaetales bacterium]|nr:monovalent cation/H(+) antiporter subunit G [Spirochaetales bacterium]
MAREIATVAVCILASIFAIAGVIGTIRFPDAYTRLHASALSGTTAVFSAFIASIIAAANAGVAMRIVVIMVFFLVSNPTTTHIIARYAWQSGLDPWKRLERKPRRKHGGGRR